MTAFDPFAIKLKEIASGVGTVANNNENPMQERNAPTVLSYSRLT